LSLDFLCERGELLADRISDNPDRFANLLNNICVAHRLGRGRRLVNVRILDDFTFTIEDGLPQGGSGTKIL
jgi:hypothetical protein